MLFTTALLKIVQLTSWSKVVLLDRIYLLSLLILWKKNRNIYPMCSNALARTENEENVILFLILVDGCNVRIFNFCKYYHFSETWGNSFYNHTSGFLFHKMVIANLPTRIHPQSFWNIEFMSAYTFAKRCLGKENLVLLC